MSAGNADDTIDAAAPQTDGVAPKVSVRAADYVDLIEVERTHYVVEGELAKGGMGRVLLARDRRLGRQVAIKELLPKNRHVARRFEREARITARLQHPAIIHIYEAGTWPGGEPFYAMTKVEGRSLDEVVAARATLNDRLGLLPHVIAVADALAYAHNSGLIHRDLKPSNVLVGEFGETVVIDWGLAKDLDAAAEAGDSMSFQGTSSEDTSSGSVIGTPAYMPPEQARGEAVDRRADVYALGALLYKVLVGASPYQADSGKQVLELVKTGPPPPVNEREPGTPPDLIAIVTKAMARDPRHRYANAGELAADLKRFQTGQLVAAHRYTARQLFWRWLRHHRLAVSIGVAAAAAIAIVATLSVSRIVAVKSRAEAKRLALLEESGRNELLDGNAGKALAYLTAAAGDGERGGVRGFLIAEAKRPIEARKQILPSGPLVAVSPDRKRVAIGGTSALEIAPLVAGEQEVPLGDRGRVRALAWSSDGQVLAAAGDSGVAWLWTRDGKRLAVLSGHRGPILDVEFGVDREVVTASADGTATVWDVTTGAPIATSTCHTGPVVSARFSSDGERVVTASEDGSACVWSARTGQTVAPVHGHDGPVNTARWAHNDRWIVTASDDGSARIWSADRGKLVVAPLRHDAGSTVRLAIVSHDGRFVLTAGSDRVARVWELPANAPEDGTVATPRLHATLEGHVDAIASAAFSDDDSLVATGGLDHVARLWDPVQGQALNAFEHVDAVESVAFAGRDRIVTGSRDGRSAVWDARASKARHDLGSPVHAIAVSADGTVAAGTDDSNVSLFRPDGTKQVLRGHMGSVFAVAFTSDGKRLVTAGWDARPIVWDVATGRRIGELGQHDPPIRAIAISSDGRLVATAASDSIHVWTIDGVLVRTFHDRATSMTTVAFSPDGWSVEGGAEDGALVAWQLGSGIAEVRRKLQTAITAIARSPRDGTLAIAGASRVELRGETITQLDNPGEVRSVAFTADGTRVITAGADGANVWDAASGKLLASRDLHGRTIEALAISHDTLWLASVDGTISAWEIPVDNESQAALAEFAASNDPWRLDDNDVLQFRRGSDAKRRSDRE